MTAESGVIASFLQLSKNLVFEVQISLRKLRHRNISTSSGAQKRFENRFCK